MWIDFIFKFRLVFFCFTIAFIPLLGHTQTDWRWLNPDPAGLALSKIVWENERAVAAGRINGLLVKAPGTAWEVITINEIELLFPRTLVFHNERFRIFGRNFRIGSGEEQDLMIERAVLSSSDGRKWTGAPTQLPLDAREVEIVDGNLIAIGSRGLFALSGDGVLWDTQQIDPTITTTGVAYGKGLWVVMGSPSLIFVSEDLQTWETIDKTIPIPPEFENNPLSEIDVRILFSDVIFSSGRFIASNANSQNPTLFVSEDGREWNEIQQENIFPEFRGYPPIVALSQNSNAIMGSSPDTATLSVDQGNTWNFKKLPSNTPLGEELTFRFRRTANFLDSITATPDGFLLAGLWGEIWSKGDGVDDPFILETPGRRDHLRAVTFGEGRYVAVGHDQTFGGLESRIWTSENLEDWSLVPVFIAGALNDLVFSGERFVAVGGNPLVSAPIGLTRIFYSDDGLNWLSATFPFSGSRKLEAIAYGNGVYCGVGPDGYILNSLDGEVWEKVSPFTEGNLRDVIYVGDNFFACGVGVVAISADGRDWTLSEEPALLDFRCGSIAYGNGQFLIADSSNGEVMASLNGSEWVQKRTKGSGIKDIDFAEGRFVAVGGAVDGSMVTSVDGQNWTHDKITLSLSYNPLHDVSYVDGKWLAVGDNGTVLLAEESLPGYIWKDAFVFGNGWKSSEWFGIFYDFRFPWIFHVDHGSQYALLTENEGELYLYDLDSEDWWWTTRELYPTFYSFNRASFNFYFKETSEPRSFVDLETGEFWFRP